MGPPGEKSLTEGWGGRAGGKAVAWWWSFCGSGLAGSCVGVGAGCRCGRGPVVSWVDEWSGGREGGGVFGRPPLRGSGSSLLLLARGLAVGNPLRSLTQGERGPAVASGGVKASSRGSSGRSAAVSGTRRRRTAADSRAGGKKRPSPAGSAALVAEAARNDRSAGNKRTSVAGAGRESADLAGLRWDGVGRWRVGESSGESGFGVSGRSIAAPRDCRRAAESSGCCRRCRLSPHSL